MIITLQTLVFFRETLFTAIHSFLRPYYKQLSIVLFNRNGTDLEDEELDDQVFSEFDEEKGVTFYPPMYAQRYAAVSDCLLDARWSGLIAKVVDFGHHDMSFIKYLKEVPGIQCILGVDIETIPLRCSSDLLGNDEYTPKRDSPLRVTLFQGNAADPDYRLIGCDAVIAIELIEHMLPHDLERFVHTVFGFIKPRIVIFTTPNADFNVLFKALEKNGLRRLDHLFEWTREQFHDWCSNIVLRYPNYNVSCKGIGPGPNGTLHYGCCSQLSLFTAKEYIKQPDLNPNSLASQLVANGQTHNNLSEVFDSWISGLPSPSPEAECGPTNQGIESLTEVLYPKEQSHMSLGYSSTLCNSVRERTYTMETFPNRDQTLQCNLDVEHGKSFMMFDEDYYHVLAPRRRVKHKVYEIEDINSRLNCTTLQVKKFSKTTQNLMAKNRIDSIVHTREVVNEIRQLTKALNFNISNQAEDGGQIWFNINWGDNAPYWNQYYKIVREYAYPFETKSDEVRILDRVSEEISRIIDTELDEEFLLQTNRIEIPLSHLMNILQDITNDVNRVRDLLEWNGYEVVNDVVIHSRLVVDATSVATHSEDWQDNDFSDWDADVYTPSLSECSTITPDMPGRCLRRALDQKVRNLRKMLLGDEDITTELDRVVCRLMKLALHSSVGREAAPPSRWMQCKLLDLLTLTEKAITRRRRCFIQSIPLEAIDNKQHPKDGHEQDGRVKDIVAKYCHLLQPLEKIKNADDGNKSPNEEIEDEFLSTTSVEFPRENEYPVGMSPSLVISGPEFNKETSKTPDATPDVNPLERTKAWLAEDIKVTPYTSHETNHETIRSGDTDTSACKARHKHKKSSKKHKTSNKANRESVKKSSRTSLSKIAYKTKRDYKNISKTGIVRNVAKNKTNYYNDIVANPDGEYSSLDYNNYTMLRNNKKHQTFNIKTSQPIPDFFMQITDYKGLTDIQQNTVISHNDVACFTVSNVPSRCISATEETCHVDIVMHDFEETIALRRTIATDTKVAPDNISKDNKDDVDVTSGCDEKFKRETNYEVSTDNTQSQTFFLNDINEPSTSKGIRHNVSMDVQCGPDSLASFSLTTASRSLAKISQGFSSGIKIYDTCAESNVKGTDFGTSTQESDQYSTITPRMRPVGIKIKDSDVNLFSYSECSTKTLSDCVLQLCSTAVHSAAGPTPVYSEKSINETKIIQPKSSFYKKEGSASNIFTPRYTSTSNTYYMNELEHTSNFSLKSLKNNEVGSRQGSPTKLTCGGVHIHSYRGQQASEDVVYQGEWQQYRPRVQKARKKITNYTSLRKSNEARKAKEIIKENRVNSKEKLFKKRQEKKQKEAEHTESTQSQNVNINKLSNEDNNGEIKKTHVKSVVKISDKINKQNIIPRSLKATAKMASKIAMSAITSKNTNSSFTVKRSAVLIKKDNDVPQSHRKSYIPLYLKRTLQSSRDDKDKLNKSLDSSSKTTTGNKDKIAPLVRSKTEEICKDLLKLSDDLHVNIGYVICRNELEDNIEAPEEQTSENSKDMNTPKQLNTLKRSISPSFSVNSSTCSSPNSIVTVRAASTRSKRLSYVVKHSTSSHKSNVTNSESDNPTPTRTKKIVKKYKSLKKMETKDIGNKENIPESTKNFINKDKGKICKFPGKPKSVSRAQIETECFSPPLSRQKAQISNKSIIKISSRRNSDERRTSIGPTVSKKRSLKSDDFIPSEAESLKTLDSSNMVFVLEPQQNYEEFSKTQNITRTLSNSEFAKKSNSSLKTSLIQNSSGYNNASNTLDSMRQLLEETLDQVIIPHGLTLHHSSCSYTLGNDNIKKANDERETSPGIKTWVDFDETNRDDKKNTLERTFDNVLGDESTIILNDMVNILTVSDLDLLSFKSITSGSRYSDYYLADNEYNTSQEIDQGLTQNTTSVHDIFERREQHLIQTTPGVLALQAFSGFSLDAEPLAGDQPDAIALQDSETGSLAVELSRQATSEEVFISGRSSDSYESCVLDDDSVVPNWLFQVISQRHSVEDFHSPHPIGPLPVPLEDPMYDANGNVIEPTMLGVGAGAGDGRGIHSDHSQDSSGRGSSLSSSDTSSGPRSEVSTVLIEPSAQYELLRDPMTSTAVIPLGPRHSLHHTCGIDEDVETVANPHDVRVRNASRSSDADVSSLDTDVPDLSDY